MTENLPTKKTQINEVAISDDFLMQAIGTLSAEEKKEIAKQVLKREIEIGQDARQRQLKSNDAINDTTTFINNMRDLAQSNSNLKLSRGTNISETGTGQQKISVIQGSGGCLSVLILFIFIFGIIIIQ